MAKTRLHAALQEERGKNPCATIVRDKDGTAWFARISFICGVPLGTQFSRRKIRQATSALAKEALKR